MVSQRYVATYVWEFWRRISAGSASRDSEEGLRQCDRLDPMRLGWTRCGTCGLVRAHAVETRDDHVRRTFVALTTLDNNVGSTVRADIPTSLQRLETLKGRTCGRRRTPRAPHSAWAHANAIRGRLPK